MGYPVRSNIFRTGTSAHKFFNSFPIQAAVLFSPTDLAFSETFRDIFLHLDQITEDRVVFFAVLDPPEDWSKEAAEREWWQEHQQSVRRLGFSFDDRTLVYEIARRYGVAWSELPALVISPNLWMAEFVTTPTSPGLIEAQLTELTELAREWGRPQIGHIVEAMEDKFGAELRYQPTNEVLRSGFSEFYDTLETYDPQQRQVSTRRYRTLLDRALRNIRLRTNILDRARYVKSGEPGLWQEERERFGHMPMSESDLPENFLFDELATETAGQLLPAATVARKAFEQLQSPKEISILDSLDEESAVMLQTALDVGDMLENLDDGTIPALSPLSFSSRRSSGSSGHKQNPIDFTPGAQGAWKSLELETNLSIIQAARAARDIRMPAFFTMHDPGCPKKRSKVQTGTRRNNDPIYQDINAPDPNHKQRHRFLTLGSGFHVANSMIGHDTEMLDQIIERILGEPMPPHVLPVWQVMYGIRNQASHIAPLSRKQYETVVGFVNSDLFEPLLRIKLALRP
jgi:hypothetical protein